MKGKRRKGEKGVKEKKAQDDEKEGRKFIACLNGLEKRNSCNLREGKKEREKGKRFFVITSVKLS